MIKIHFICHGKASRCWRIMRNITAELAQIAANEINDLYR